MARRWNDARFNAWVEGTHIPEDVMKMVEMIAEKIGISVYETTVDYKNVWGENIGVAKGFQLSHCTSSLADGPSEDMTPVFMKWIKGLGFEVCGSYGDNGLDSATNWHDTYWYTEIAYSGTMVMLGDFYDYYDRYDDEDY
jgi:hypothetical protein